MIDLVELSKAFSLQIPGPDGRVGNLKSLIRMAGGMPTEAQLSVLPQTATLSELQEIIFSKKPEAFGFHRSIHDDQHISEEQEEFEHILNIIDKHKSGRIVRSDFVEALTKYGEPLSKSQVSELLNDPRGIFTHSQTGAIDIEKFVNMLTDHEI